MNAQVAKSTVAQAFRATLMFARCEFSRTHRRLRKEFVALIANAHRAMWGRRVNTSLSGTLFFLGRWCIRDAVHFDSRMHAAKSHLTTLGGQHGEEG
jgi:hypothetical protein